MVVPAFNEARTIQSVLRRVRDLPFRSQLIVIDDGSTDGTSEILLEMEAAGEIDRLILHVQNRGKGAAIRAAFREATGDIVVVQDADLEYDPADLPGVVEPIVRGWADAVYGSRSLGAPRRAHLFWHAVGNRLATVASNLLTNLSLTDVQTGRKAIRRDLLESLPLTQERFGIEAELTARLAQAQACVFEVPVPYRGRTYEEGKKIGLLDGLVAPFHILRSTLFPPRARRWERPTGDPS